MPQKTQTFFVPNYNTEDALALSYGVFTNLNWVPKYAGPERLIGFTKISWGNPHETIIVEATNENISVTSKLPESASWDLLNKNQKNLNKFALALEAVKQTATDEKLSQWKSELAALRKETEVVIEKQTKESQEVEKVMHLSGRKKTITYGIMIVNVTVFLLMAITGVNVFSPTTNDIVQWGGNVRYLTIDEGQWWRLFSCMFLHIGLVHLLFNMYALYMAGVYLEPMLGRMRFAFAYVVTGILASFTSIWWHGDDVVSAGASGAIFGLYGVFLALLTTKLIPQSVRKALLQSIGIFVFYNLAYGLKAGIDNAAHLGGVVSGFVLGYIYYPMLKNRVAAETTS